MKKRLVKTLGSLMLAVVLLMTGSISSSAAYSRVDGYAQTTTVKGLQGSPGYGSQHIFFNFDIRRCYIPDNYVECGVPYFEFEGKSYRFTDYNYVLGKISNWNQQGLTTNVQFMISWEPDDTLAQRRLLVDESARTATGVPYYAPATTGEGRQILRAFWAWVMYTLDKNGAHIDNLILGNEVNMPNSWHYSGGISAQDKASKYALAFYDMRQAVRQYTNNARVSVCLDHSWTHNDEGRGIAGRDFLSMFNSALTAYNGGVPVNDWCVALHLYPAILYETAIWRDAPGFPSNLNALSQDAYFVDGRNLSYITNYIKNTYGENHRIMLTEQGFTNYRGDDNQAAALAYSYYAAKYDPMVDSFILNTETTGDSRLNFSISGKLAESVYNAIDDPSQQDWIANRLLPVIGASSWSQIIPNYGQTITRKKYVGEGHAGVDPESISISPSSVNVEIGQTATLTVQFYPADVTDRRIVWNSTNPAVIYVDQEGVVRVGDLGTATITATAVNGLQAQCTVNAVLNPVGITLDTTEKVMAKGEQLTLNANIVPYNATEKSVTWSSSNTAVATVNNGVVTAKSPGKATITVQTVNGYTAKCEIITLIDNDSSNPFADVSPSGWEYPFVSYAFEHQYINGKGELVPGRILFDPNTPIKRAEFVQILYNLEGRPPVTFDNRFSDISEGKWYTDAVIWAAQEDIVNGMDGKFKPMDPASREQLARMFHNYAQYKGYNLENVLNDTLDVTNFGDSATISSWAGDAMQWAVQNEILNGDGYGNLDPKGKAKRSHCAKMLQRLIENVQERQVADPIPGESDEQLEGTTFTEEVLQVTEEISRISEEMIEEAP